MEAWKQLGLTSSDCEYARSVYTNMEAGSCRNTIRRLGLDVRGKRVLEVGFGPGQLLIELAKDSPAAVIGSDFSAAWARFGAVEMARRGIERAGLVRADAMSLPFRSDAFDVVICFLTLPYVADDEATIRELARVLKPGGTLAVSGHDIGFPLHYLKQLRFRQLLIYPITVVYRLTGHKPYRNTLQTHAALCRQMARAGVAVQDVVLTRGTLNLALTCTARGVKTR